MYAALFLCLIAGMFLDFILKAVCSLYKAINFMDKSWIDNKARYNTIYSLELKV